LKPLSGIYSITNTVTGKIYIGQTTNLNKRKAFHYWELNNNRHNNAYLQNAYNKYGKDNFIFQIILYCEKHELTRYEQSIVDITTYIYNIRKLCVNSNKGFVLSEDTKRLIGEKNKGRIASEETRYKLSNSHKGQAAWNKGMACSEKTRLKLSEVNKGKKHSEETKRNISSGNKGRVVSDETRRKLSESNKGNIPWTTGKVHSQETRNKISEAIKAYWKCKHAVVT
jgi:group I intron endonuclease